jgi:hypothetical protein
MSSRVPSALGTVAVLVAIVSAGCGYSLRGNLPAHLKTVGVPVFANRTAEPAIENVITSAVAEAFSTNGRLRVVRPAEADALLEGEITGYELQSIAFDPRANVRQYRLLVTMNVLFRDVRRNAVLFEQRNLQERADFNVAGAVSETIVREEASVRRAAIEIGRTLVSRAVDRF